VKFFYTFSPGQAELLAVFNEEAALSLGTIIARNGELYYFTRSKKCSPVIFSPVGPLAK